MGINFYISVKSKNNIRMFTNKQILYTTSKEFNHSYILTKCHNIGDYAQAETYSLHCQLEDDHLRALGQ